MRESVSQWDIIADSLGVILTQASLIAPAFVSSYMVIRGYPGPRNLSSHGFFRIPRTYMHL